MLKRDKVHSKCTARCSGIFLVCSGEDSAVREDTDCLRQELRQQKGLGLGLELGPEAVRLQFADRRQNSKHALYHTATPKCGWNKEQEADGAGSDLTASSGHRTLGFVVSALCFLSRFSQIAEFHAKAHIVSSGLTGSALPAVTFM